jgi:hypothetical protein
LVPDVFCVRAEAATLFTCAGVLGLLRSFDAVDATLLDVLSFVGFLIVLTSFQPNRSAGYIR